MNEDPELRAWLQERKDEIVTVHGWDAYWRGQWEAFDAVQRYLILRALDRADVRQRRTP